MFIEFVNLVSYVPAPQLHPLGTRRLWGNPDVVSFDGYGVLGRTYAA